MTVCQECGDAPLYYDDPTNGRFLCRVCHSEITDGKRRPKDRMSTSTKETFDFADAQSTALVATNDTQELATAWLSFRVQSEEDRKTAIATAKAMKEVREQLEAERDSGVKPLLSVVDRIRGWFRKPIEGLAAIEKHLKDDVGRYRAELEAAQRAALTEAKNHAEVERAVAVLTPKVEGEGSRTTWKAEVVTTPAQTFAMIEALVEGLPPCDNTVSLRSVLANRLPDAYIGVDQVALNKVAVAMKTKFNVPGAKAVPTTSVVLR